MFKFFLLVAACLVMVMPALFAGRDTSFSADIPPAVTATPNTDTNFSAQVPYCYLQYDYYLNTGSVLDTSNTRNSVNNYSDLYNQINMDANSVTNTNPDLLDPFKNNEVSGDNLQMQKIEPIKLEKENTKQNSSPSATNLSE